MKTFSVNKDSWHYRLNVKMAKTNERLEKYDYAEKFVQSKDNFCSYWRMTSWSMFKVAVAATFIGALIVAAMYVFYSLGYLIVFHPVNTLIAAALLVTFLGVSFGLFVLSTWLDKRKRQKLDAIIYDGETETSLAKAKYSSWKGGICLPVEFKG